MTDTNESFHESVIIKRAKRRLIGAITILIILFTLSLFFIKNTSEIDNSKIKVSFLEMGKASFINSKEKEDLKSYESDSKKISKKSNLKNPEKSKTELFTIQIGIYSDAKKTKQLSGKINDIGFQTRMIKINLSGKEKIKLMTEVFSTKKEAQLALRKLKNANFPGLIKPN